jgi:bifunctional non-homologous end joining protein LigD
MPKLLDDYSRKRRFDSTPEPGPKVAQAAGNRFYIQRHQARRLHYDLRLESDGVLKSWAVPKGPTLDPAEKRLAVLVEDHPMEYGNFEGTIPAGNYGAGSVMVWDRGTYEVLGEKSVAEQMERGDFKFRLHGEKLMGEFALVRMKNRGKGNEWLLLKKKDFAAKPGWDAEQDLRSVGPGNLDPAKTPGAKRAEMPRDLTPMLAVAASSLPEGAEWLYEVKWDGWRALCFVEGKKVRLVSRNGKPMDKQYPELAVLPEVLGGADAVLDGEIVALDEQGRPSFELLQQRIGFGGKGVTQEARSRPVVFFAFDLPWCNGYDLRATPLLERKKLLASLLTPTPAVRLSEHFTGNGQKLLAGAREQGLEGVMAKRALSAYDSQRSADWVKVKIVAQQDFVIAGMVEGEREPFGSLALGVYEREKLVFSGNFGSGFDQESLKRVHSLLKPLATQRCPFAEPPQMLTPAPVTWVKPEVVCTVRFAQWTKDGRLRAPVFHGIRTDVSPRDCVREVAEAAPAATTTTTIRPKLLEGKQAEVLLTVGKQRLKFTNLNKVFWPREGYVKRDLINYYYAVAELILPHLKDRPLSLKRYPNGIEGKYFFQKEAAESFPDWLRTEAIFSEHNQAPINYVVADDRASLLYLANLGCIDQNPWMSRVGSLEHPDFVLLDLDPYSCGYDRIVEAAQLVRAKLELLELAAYPKTTGGDGMHVYIPLQPEYSYEQSRTFAEVLARLCAHERPDLFTTPRTVAHREQGKVYFDYLQNREGSTIAAPYVLRAHPGAPVSTPLSWSEVGPGLTPAQFHLGNVLDRFARVGDLFAPVLNKPQRLELSLAKMEELVRAAGAKK